MAISDELLNSNVSLHLVEQSQTSDCLASEYSIGERESCIGLPSEKIL